MKLKFTILLFAVVYSTIAQPLMVRDIAVGSASSIPSNSTIAQMMPLGDFVFFKADDGVHGRELWRSDGTLDGTYMVRDIYPGTSNYGVSNLFIVFDSALYFEARDVAYGSELWRSDGTTAGTYLFWDACPGSCSGTTYGNFPPEFASFNNLLFLRASATGIGTELFSTNGDSANVSLVKDINPGSFSGSPGRFHVWNNHFYFSASDLGSAREIWVSDGTAGGTQLLKDINPGGFSAGDPEHLTPAKNGLFFSAVSPNIGRELWKTDGTPGGTVLVKDINPGSANGISTSEFQAVGDYVVFIANDGATGTEVWSSDGTEQGTQLLKNIGPGNSLASFLGVLNDKLLFTAYDNSNGSELWVTDGTPAGTVFLKDIYAGFLGSDAVGGSIHNGKMYFVASDNVHGRELWQTDGTAAGTTLLADVVPGITSSSPNNLVLAGSTLYFFANTNEHGQELWKFELAPPVALMEAPDSACQSETIVFLSPTPVANTWLWEFGSGAQPMQAQGKGPHSVSYSTAGIKSARLIVANAFGADTVLQSIEVSPTPLADFTFQTTDLEVSFQNASLFAQSYEWSFGDGAQSNEANPIHVYTAPGPYTVLLKATNACSTHEKSIAVVLTSNTNEILEAGSIRVFPNPTSGHFQLFFEGVEDIYPVKLSLVDALGKIMRTLENPGKEQSFLFEYSDIEPGIYFLQLQFEERFIAVPVVIRQE